MLLGIKTFIAEMLMWDKRVRSYIKGWVVNYVGGVERLLCLIMLQHLAALMDFGAISFVNTLHALLSLSLSARHSCYRQHDCAY